MTDNEPPAFQGPPSDISQNNDPNQATAVVSWVEPTATDNLGGVTLSSNHNPGDNFAIGFTNITYKAIDNTGNEAVISFTIEVTGNILIKLYNKLETVHFLAYNATATLDLFSGSQMTFHCQVISSTFVSGVCL